MNLLITGTPGTGKTTVSRQLAAELGAKLVAVNQLIKERGIYTGVDPDKKYLEVDIASLKEEMDTIIDNEKEDYPWIIFEGHLSHYCNKSDLVIVLRTSPSVLKYRLKDRGWKRSKIVDNLQAEAIDVCAWEAHDLHGSRSQEVDTTEMTPDEVVEVILRIIDGKESHPIGKVNFLEELEF
jgi:adenylate kinase